MEYLTVLDIDLMAQGTFGIAVLVQLARVTVECQQSSGTRRSETT